jgi:hypothetical protein
VPSDLTPFPKPGARFVDVVGADEAPHPKAVIRREPIPYRDRLLFVVWCVGLFAVSLTATLAIVHRAVARAPHSVATHYIVVWAATAGGLLVLLAILGGLLVFRPATRWKVVVCWPLLGGAVVASGYWFGIAGQMNSGSTLCPANNSCDISWGLGAAALAVASAIALAGLFAATFALRRLLGRVRGLRDPNATP